MNRRRTRAAVPALVGVIGLLAAAGCSDDGGPGYAVPAKFCGVPVKERALAPLLPDGEQLEAREETMSSGRELCRLVVDGASAVSVTLSDTREFHDPMAEIEEFRFKHRKQMEGLPFDGKGALGDRSATVTAKCGGSGPPYLMADFEVTPKATDDTAQRRADLQSFAEAFLTGVKKKRGCAA